MTPEQTQAYLLWLNKGSPPGSLGDAFLGGPVAPIQGATIVNTIADLRARQNLSDGDNFLVLGYWAIGDAPVVLYEYSASSSATDNGGTVIAPSSGGGRFLAGPALNSSMIDWPNSDTRNWGCTASDFTTTGSVSATLATLTLASAGDFVNGQPISIFGAGAAATAIAPTGGTGTSGTTSGQTGTSTYYYKVASIDVNCAISAASTEIVSDGLAASTLGTSVDLRPNGAAYVTVAWSAATNATAYAVWGGSMSGAEVFLGITTNTSFIDFGVAEADPAPAWVPASPPSSTTGGLLTTSISAGAGTTTLTLANAATTSVTSGVVIHDDTAGLQSALATLGTVLLADGTCDITSGLTHSTEGQTICGNSYFNSTIRAWGGFDVITSTGTMGGGCDIHIICSNLFMGRAFVMNGGSRRKWFNINVTDAFDGLYIYNKASFDYYEHWHWYGSQRGNFEVFMYGTDTASVSLQWFNAWQDVQAPRCSGVLIDGNCASIWLFNFTLQSKPTICHVYNDTGGSLDPRLLIFFRLATNFMTGTFGVRFEAGNNVILSTCYLQSCPGTAGRVLTLSGTTNGIIISDSYIFGADEDGVLINQVVGVQLSVTYVYANGGGSAGGYAAVRIIGSSSNVDISGGGNLKFGATSADAVSEDYGVYITGNSSNISVAGQWQGRIANINNLVSPGGNVQLQQAPTGSPVTSTYTTDADLSMTVSAYPAVYQGTAGKVAFFEMSGQTHARTITTDTATNIVNSIKGVTVGTTFRIRVANHTGFAHTMAGGTGVTVAGSSTIAASPLGVRSCAYQDYDCTVTATVSPAVTFFGVTM